MERKKERGKDRLTDQKRKRNRVTGTKGRNRDKKTKR
jgi:hypothetical protein